MLEIMIRVNTAECRFYKSRNYNTVNLSENFNYIRNNLDFATSLDFTMLLVLTNNEISL